MAPYARIVILQHGFDHLNGAGAPPSEFSPTEDPQDVAVRLVKGWALLQGFRRRLPVYVPPWNVLTPNVAAALAISGHRAVSGWNGFSGPGRIDAHLDLLRWRDGPRFAGSERILGRLTALLEQRRRQGRWDEPIGLLTHHLAHDEEAWRFLDELLLFPPLQEAAHWPDASSLFDLRAVRTGATVQQRRRELTAPAVSLPAVRAQGGPAILFAAVFVLTTLLAYLSPLGLAPLVALAGLASLMYPRAPPSRGAVLGLGALFLWAAISLIWSPARPWLHTRSLISAIEHVSLLELGLLAVLAALAMGAGLRLEPGGARLSAAALRWSVLGLALLLAVDSADRGAIYGALARVLQPGEDADLVRIYTARGGYVLAVLMWPWLATLSGRARWLAPAPFVAVAAVSLLLHEAAPLTAVLAGSAAFALVFVGGSRGAAILADCTPLTGLARRGWCGWPSVSWISTAWRARSGLPGRSGSASGASPSTGWSNTHCAAGAWTPPDPSATPFPCTRMTPPCRSGSNWACPAPCWSRACGSACCGARRSGPTASSGRRPRRA